ncbi:MAG: Na+/H+ antiporter subunit E [Gammaproteobacteria bacterium]|nr:Na+/H+ antiporter subunit E [Gammaproteobacteria bacterium]MCF6363236.1 Na+/H+ antiporter subunit E [Gammaproteobacteria bacterium]
MMRTLNQRQRLGTTPRNTVFARLQSGCLRAVLFALMWWILTDGAMDSWLIGAPVVLLATSISVALLPPFSWSLPGVVRFVPFFLWRSLSGGVDVAWRALHPRLPISPGLFCYPWRLPPGLPRVFMANIVSLLPGTLSTELGTDCLQVHVLDERKDFLSELETVEQRVAAMFGISLLPPESVDSGSIQRRRMK